MKPRTIAQWEMDKQINETDPDRRLKTAYIPEIFWRKTWADYDDVAKDAKGKSLKEALRYFAKTYNEYPSDGLTIIGPAGYGKTFGTTLLAMELVLSGVWCKQLTYKHLSDRRKDLIGIEKQAEATDDWSDYNAAAYRLMFIERECDVLFLDDIGKEYRSPSGWNADYLDDLLRTRVQLGKATVMTSNLDHQEWARYNSSMASFLYDIGEIFTVVDGKDHRVRLSPRQRARDARG